ncbi:unnamed protein product, partial [Durusdinium trenchii]
KKPEMKEKGSAEKHKEKNSRAAKSQCRPANFGKKQEQASSLLAKPGRKVAFPEDKSKRKSKDQPKAAEDEQEDDDEFELGEDHEIDLQCPRIRRKRHERKCRKLVASESIVKQKALRSYLGAVGITWPAFQKAHARLAEVKKASGCSNGSFVDFQNRLLNGKKAKNDCPACNHLLTRSGFCTSDLDIHLDKALNGEEDPFIPVDTPGTQPEATRDQADQSEAEEETPEDWLMKFDFLEVLQP